MLQALQQTEAPVVVAQGIVDTAFALSILGGIDIAEDTVLALLEDLLELVFLHVAEDVGIGLVSDEDALGVRQTASGIGLDDGLHRRLGVNVLTVIDLLHVETGLALHGDGNLTDQIIEGRLRGFRIGIASTFAPYIVIIGLNAGDFIQRLLCRRPYGQQQQSRYA